MGCTNAYLEEHPCDVPWMPDENGACTILIEDHIAEHGPSRRVFMAYHLLISTVCVALNLKRLRDALGDPELRQHFRGCRLWRQPKVLRLVALVYACLMILLQAIDVRGYGGRLPFALWLYCGDQATFGLLSAVVVSLCTWYFTLEDPAAAMLQRGRLLALKWIGTVCLSQSFFLLPLLQLYLTPRDAPDGVTNGGVSVVKAVLSNIFLTVVVADFAYEHHRQAAMREEHLASGPGAAQPARSSNLKVHPTTAMTAPSTPRGACMKTPSTTMNEMHRPTPRKVPCAPPKVDIVPTEAALHQMRFLLYAGVFTSFCGWILVGFRARSALCYVYTTPPDTQWFDFVSVALLASAALLTCVPVRESDARRWDSARRECTPEEHTATASGRTPAQRGATPSKTQTLDRHRSPLQGRKPVQTAAERGSSMSSIPSRIQAWERSEQMALPKSPRGRRLGN